LVKDFLSKNNVMKLEHPPYSPDLAAAVFLPDPSTKISSERASMFVMLLTSLRMQWRS